MIRTAKMMIIIESFWCFFGPASVRSYKIGVVGNNWLVGNAIFSEIAVRVFLIFWVKLGDYKGRKVTARYLKKLIDLEKFSTRSPNLPKIRHFSI